MRERQSNKQLNLLNMYRNIKISKIELKNASGTVCSLECYYKMGKDDKPHLKQFMSGRHHHFIF